MAQELPDLALFIDECLGSADVPNALRKAGIQCEVLSAHFAPGTPDEHWLREVGDRDWVVVTGDTRIRRRQAEKQALLEAKLVAFVLTSGNLTGAAAGKALVAAYPKMQRLVRDHAAPFIASVTRTGAVSLLTAPGRRPKRK